MRKFRVYRDGKKVRDIEADYWNVRDGGVLYFRRLVQTAPTYNPQHTYPLCVMAFAPGHWHSVEEISNAAPQT